MPRAHQDGAAGKVQVHAGVAAERLVLQQGPLRAVHSEGRAQAGGVAPRLLRQEAHLRGSGGSHW